jgi:uncharacterized damage-inducible protein DinB
MAESLPEVWLRGPLPDVPWPLQPAAHSFLQVQEEMRALLPALDDEILWARAGGAASIGFHALHLAQATDRLLTYARGEALSASQRAALASESEPPRESAGPLLSRVESAITAALAQLRATDPASLVEVRAVGARQLPATVGGLLFHAAEHAQRHAGQAATTAKILRGLAAAR